MNQAGFRFSHVFPVTVQGIPVSAGVQNEQKIMKGERAREATGDVQAAPAGSRSIAQRARTFLNWGRSGRVTVQPAAAAAVCQWRDGETCQFTGLQHTVSEFGGRMYCRAHAPEGPSKIPHWVQEYINALAEEAGQGGSVNLRGVVVPGYMQLFLEGYRQYVFHDCQFGPQLTLHARGENCVGEFRRATFGDGCSIVGAGLECLDCTDAIFSGQLAFNLNGSNVRLRFVHTRFEGQVSFAGIGDRASLDLTRAVFAAVPSVSGKLPQQTTLQNVEFLPSARTADSEGAYRALRLLFSANRAREWEGVCYAHERRSQRRSLSWRSPGQWFPKIISGLYDLSSQYGQSYGRAFSLLIAVQLIFGIGYSLASGRFGLGQIDWSIVAFTLAQVAKPFDLMSTSHAVDSYGVLANSACMSCWRLAAFAQSVLSISLLALFVLALRWRFRRE